MISLVFKNLYPCPRNRSHSLVKSGNRVMNIKTELARLFEEDIKGLLKGFDKEREAFVKEYNPSKGLHAEAFFYSPDLYTKLGHISKTSIDWDAHKVFWDTVHKWLGIDDSQVVKVEINKIEGNEHSVVVIFRHIK